MRQADGGVKPVEYGQGDGDMDKDGPGVLAIDTDRSVRRQKLLLVNESQEIVLFYRFVGPVAAYYVS